MKLLKIILLDWDEYLKLHSNNIFKKILIFIPVAFFNYGIIFSLLYRVLNYFFYSRYLKIFYFLFYPIYFIVSYYIMDIDIHPNVKIGYGLYVHNKGIIIAQGVNIGNNAKLIGPITIGVSFNKVGSAKIGNAVTISTGARIIGPVSVGNNVVIGANAVVVNNFSDNVVIGGVPARIIKNNN